MYIYIDTVKVARLIMLVGKDEFFKIKDVTRDEVDKVLHGCLDASLLTYLRVANSLNMSLDELVFMAYDEKREITIKGIVKDDLPIPY